MFYHRSDDNNTPLQLEYYKLLCFIDTLRERDLYTRAIRCIDIDYVYKI